MKSIPYVNLIKQAESQRKDIFLLLNKIIKKGQFVGGVEIDKYEKNICKLLKVKHCVALNSGTDALFLALKCLDLKKDSEVILPAQTYVSTIFAVIRAGHKPILVDIKKNNPT